VLTPRRNPKLLALIAVILATCAALAAVAPSMTARAEEPEEPVKEEAKPPQGEPHMRRMPMRIPVRLTLADMLRDDAGLIRVEGLHAVLIGTLIEAESGHPGWPSDYCLEDGKLWTGASFRVGDLPVFGLPRSKTVSDSAGGTVLMSAERKASIDDKVVDAGPCPAEHGKPWRMMQWRDDWTAPEGQHLPSFGPGGASDPWTHARLKALPYYEATEAEPLRVITVEVISTKASAKRATKAVAITVHNVLNAPLTLPLSLHYEGGGGKPSPRYVEVKLSIPPGEQHTVTADLSLFDGDPATKAGRQGEFVLQSIDLRGVIGQVTLDIAQPIP
jgi:hypothetical protein